MSIRRSAGTIFWGVTLISIGGMLLAHNLGYTIHVWPYVVRYWPALLIGWGLLKFVDYFRFRHAGDNRPLFSGGEVALLILVIFTGSAVTTAANLSPEIGNIFEIGDLDLWDITGNNYNYEQHREQQNVPQGSEIEIVNLFGNVEVRPSESDSIVIDVTKTIRAGDKNEADRLDADFTFRIQGEGSSYRITSNRDESGFSGLPRQRFKSSLTIQVPRQSMLHVNNRNGRVVVHDVNGNQNIVNRYGEIEIRNITGSLQVETRNGSVSVEDVTGAVGINNRYANTTVKHVGADLNIQTRNGSVDVSGVTGNVTIDNSYAPINVENVEGQLTISGRNNSIDVEHVKGDIRSDSSYQNVAVKDPGGAVSISARNGDITLSFLESPQKDISVDARYANVTLELPSSARFSIDARTQYGDVNSEFDGLNINMSRRDKNISGKLGEGGPQVRITTRNGNIRLERRG